MWIHLKNGRSFYFKDGKNTEIDMLYAELWVMNEGGEVIATFNWDSVATFFSEGVDVTTFGPTDKLEVTE